MHRCLALTIAALALAAAAGCSSDSEPPPTPQASGPEEALQEFYRSLNDGDYASAMLLYGQAALDVWEDPALAGESSFEKWARDHTHGGQIDSVSVIRESAAGPATNLEYKLVFRDGASVQHKVDLVQEEGRWKLGLIS